MFLRKKKGKYSSGNDNDWDKLADDVDMLASSLPSEIALTNQFSTFRLSRSDLATAHTGAVPHTQRGTEDSLRQIAHEISQDAHQHSPPHTAERTRRTQADHT